MKKSNYALPDPKPINCALQSRAEIDQCTEELQNYGLLQHPISCKNWDIARIIGRVKDGAALDMGCSGGSVILENAHLIGIEGRKIGIDLEYTEDSISPEGIEKKRMDLMKTTFEDKSFQTIFCLSVLEHAVIFSELAKECGRLLKFGGQLFITCDFFDPAPDTSLQKLYSLDWTILNKDAVLRLIDEMKKEGLQITSEPNFTTTEAVINPAYCSPVQGVSYSFFVMEFIKD